MKTEPLQPKLHIIVTLNITIEMTVGCIDHKLLLNYPCMRAISFDVFLD